MARRRLLYLTSTLPASADDGEPRFVLDLARAVRAVSTDYDVHILAPSFVGAGPRAWVEGIPVTYYRYWNNPGETLAYPGAILPKLRSNRLNVVKAAALCTSLLYHTRRAMAALQPDIVHAHWLIPQGVAAAFATPRHIPLIHTAYAADIFALNRGTPRALKRYALRRARHTVAGSPEGLAQLVALAQSPNFAAQYLPQGFDGARFGPHLRRRQSNGTVRFLYVGRLAEKKGLPVLLRALAGMTELPWELQIVGRGDGDYQARLRAQAEEQGLGTRVHFLGARPHAQLGSIMADADVFCHPSVITGQGDRDGVPTVLIEAAASGLPLIGSRVGGIAEVVRPENGLLHTPGDVNQLQSDLRRLIREPETRRAMARASLRMARFFTWETVANAYCGIYRSAMC